MRSRLLLGAVLFLLTACSSTHAMRREGAAPRLSKESQVFVSLPADGKFEKIAYAGSGEMTLQAVVLAFKKHINQVVRGSSVQAQDAALLEAQTRSCTHLVIPQIMHWEDRATEWSGKLDRLEVQLVLVEVSTGATLDKATLTATGKWMTFGGDHPQGLLPKSVDEYVASLF